MAATFRTRPARLSLNQLLRHGPPRPSHTLLSLTSTARPAQSAHPPPSQIRHNSAGRMEKAFRQQQRQTMANQVSPTTAMQDLEATDMPSSALDILAPGTFVPHPLSSMPPGARHFIQYQWVRFKTKVYDLAVMLFSQHMTRPKFFGKAGIKLNRKSIIPNAKALHRTVAEAMAAGDKETLQKVCRRKVYNSLANALEARARSDAAKGVKTKYTWELVRYTGSPFWPRIVDNKWLNMALTPTVNVSFRQAVVGIKSRQRLVKWDLPRGKKEWVQVPGSEKEKDLLEYIAIRQDLDATRHATGQWKYLGSLQPTTLEEYEFEKKTQAAAAAQ